MSYEFKGTPGPWCFGAKDEKYQIVEVDAPNGDGVNVSCWSGLVRCYGSHVDDYVFDQAIANARAIATVPELIEALEDMRTSCKALNLEEALEQEMENAEAALAKATGGSDD